MPLPQHRGLEVPEALIATAHPDLREFGESFTRQGLRCFGSRYLPGVTVKWEASLRRRVEDADAILTRLLVFDAFIENGDRSAAHNPNLLVSNGKLFAIDHGQSLPSVRGITGKSLPYPFDSHLGWSIATERPHLLESPVDDLRALSDAGINAAVEAVPAGWWRDEARADSVREALRVRRDRLPATIRQIMETHR